MESIRIPYKTDDFGNPMFARISWSNTSSDMPKPIVLIFHAGGFIVGSSEMIPAPQIHHLAAQNFLVVVPNYRLAPQVPASVAFADAEEVFEWTTTTLPSTLQSSSSSLSPSAAALQIDTSRVATMGHSAGGTLALHLASLPSLNIHAVTAFYPSLYLSEPNTSAAQPTSAPPFGAAPDFAPSQDDWELIRPAEKQLSEAPLFVPGVPPPPRSRWQMHIIKHGKWLETVQPDGAYERLDPMRRDGGRWGSGEKGPAVRFVQGDADFLPGSGLQLVRRAEEELVSRGVVEVGVTVVEGEGHMFDLPPVVGTSDCGARWEAVVEGLNWLKTHV